MSTFVLLTIHKQYRMLHASTQAGGVELSVLPMVRTYNISNVNLEIKSVTAKGSL